MYSYQFFDGCLVSFLYGFPIFNGCTSHAVSVSVFFLSGLALASEPIYILSAVPTIQKYVLIVFNFFFI